MTDINLFVLSMGMLVGIAIVSCVKIVYDIIHDYEEIEEDQKNK